MTNVSQNIDDYNLSIPDGYCQCGCGQKVENKFVRGHRKESALFFLHGVKQCTQCKQIKSIEQFHKKKHLNRYYPRSICILCDRQHRAKKTRIYRYGVTTDDLQRMLQDQNFTCAICGTTIDKTCSVDHCHLTNKVRGLLCRACNTGIGMLRDDSDLLRAAIRYLEGE